MIPRQGPIKYALADACNPSGHPDQCHPATGPGYSPFSAVSIAAHLQEYNSDPGPEQTETHPLVEAVARLWIGFPLSLGQTGGSEEKAASSLVRRKATQNNLGRTIRGPSVNLTTKPWGAITRSLTGAKLESGVNLGCTERQPHGREEDKKNAWSPLQGHWADDRPAPAIIKLSLERSPARLRFARRSWRHLADVFSPSTDGPIRRGPRLP